jgi:hypothetical protein
MARGTAFAMWWVDRYTRGLPSDVRERRRAEIASDVFEHTHAVGARGADVAWRTARGVHADLAWRREERRLVQASHRPPSRLRTSWGVVTQNWFAPLAVLVCAFDILLAIGVATEDDGKMPGQAIGPVVLATFGVTLAVGLWLRWRAGHAQASRLAVDVPRRPVSSRWIAGTVGLLVVCLAVLVVGVSAGTPSVFFLGFGLLAVTAAAAGGLGIARAVRSSDPAHRVALADGMIVVGVLPALAMFWMIVPALVAIAVIVGVLTTNPRIRPAT